MNILVTTVLVEALQAIAQLSKDTSVVDCESVCWEIHDLAMGAIKKARQSADKLIPISEVNPMSLSPEVIQLAHIYVDIIDQQDRGDFDNGLSPVELDAKRTMYHNRLIRALKECGVDVSNRLDTTELAKLIRRWVPD